MVASRSSAVAAAVVAVAAAVAAAAAAPVCVAAAGGASVEWPELFPYNPVAPSSATVVNGNARFTVLTDRLIRMEWTNGGNFEDRATPAFVNRAVSPVPKFTQSTSGGVLTITTAAVEVKYTVGRTFSRGTLSARSVTSSSSSSARYPDAGPGWSWSYGDQASGNLLGTVKSLDELGVVSLNCTQNAHIRVHDESLHCEWGLVSRQGWVVVNDTNNWALSQSGWWASPNRDGQDLYLFGHGQDYVGALADYVKVGGRTAMVPRHAAGIWWSIWWNLNNWDVRHIVEEYQNHAVPLDVYVLDMDWHTKQGWGGYSFDQRLFAFPQATMGWLHDQGLITLANLHDDDGVRSSEDEYGAMCAAIGGDFPECGKGQTVPFDWCGPKSQAYAKSLEDTVLGAVEKQGMDYWWIDWQQGGTQGGCAGLAQNPTIWLNKLRATDFVRRGDDKRGMVLARWGGLGNHRYQVGFSGDVAAVTWTNLAFQPYFSLTASNVAYGFWSHDLVGPAHDHELFTRWLQWGTVSGVFRTHDRGMSAGSCANSDSCDNVRIWNMPTKYFEAARAAMQAREALVPYIYTASREAFDTGVSLLRPMYYYWPSLSAAYGAAPNGDFAQFMFGPDILAAPVVHMAPANTSMAVKRIWLPPVSAATHAWRRSPGGPLAAAAAARDAGRVPAAAAAAAAAGPKYAWFQENTGVLITDAACGKDGLMLQTSFDLSEVPLFVRAGAVVPRQPVVAGDTVGLASRQYAALEFSIYPGAASGAGAVYEDDGATTAYATKSTGSSAVTTCSYTRTDGASSTTVKASITTQGSFPELPAQRAYTVRLRNFLPLAGATATYTDAASGRLVRAAPVSFRRRGLLRSTTTTSAAAAAGPTWSFDGPAMTVVVSVPAASTSSPVHLTLTTVDAVDDAALSGISGGLRHAQMAKRLFDETRVTPGAHSVTGGNLSVTATIGDELEWLAAGEGKDLALFAKLVAGFRTQFALAVSEVAAMAGQPPYVDGQLVQLYNADRTDNVLCGDSTCVSTNSNYKFMRVEGYQPRTSEPNAIPLNDYWNAGALDNLDTMAPTPPQGYVDAIFANGFVLSQATTGTVPLQLWHSDARKDYLTVASPQGIAYAKANSYTLVNATVGHVYSTPRPYHAAAVAAAAAAAGTEQQPQQASPLQPQPQPQPQPKAPQRSPVTGVNYDRWSHAMELLATAHQ